jgi:hypothetical protein
VASKVSARLGLSKTRGDHSSSVKSFLDAMATSWERDTKP